MAGLMLRSSSRGFHCARIASSPQGLRADGWWIKDHRARKYPETEEERRAAALRYGLRPEDYKSYHPTVQPTGDYPNLGIVTYDHKDPYENWSHDHHRRNWGEQVTWDWDKYRPDRVTFTGLEREILEGGNTWKLWGTFLTWFGSAILIFWWLLSDYNNDMLIKMQLVKPVMPKAYPYDYYRAWPFEHPMRYPIKNYSFEPADEDEGHH